MVFKYGYFKNEIIILIKLRLYYLIYLMPFNNISILNFK